MAVWRCFGSERRENFEKELSPDNMADTLAQYQKKFGKAFGVQELLALEKVRGMALIAEAINDAPEFLLDQIGIARKDSSFSSLVDGLESIADAISESTT